jgi:hypothetical protein
MSMCEATLRKGKPSSPRLCLIYSPKVASMFICFFIRTKFVQKYGIYFEVASLLSNVEC